MATIHHGVGSSLYDTHCHVAAPNQSAEDSDQCCGTPTNADDTAMLPPSADPTLALSSTKQEDRDQRTSAHRSSLEDSTNVSGGAELRRASAATASPTGQGAVSPPSSYDSGVAPSRYSGVAGLCLCATSPLLDWDTVAAIAAAAKSECAASCVIPAFGVHPWWAADVFEAPNTETSLTKEASVKQKTQVPESAAGKHDLLHEHECAIGHPVTDPTTPPPKVPGASNTDGLPTSAPVSPASAPGHDGATPKKLTFAVANGATPAEGATPELERSHDAGQATAVPTDDKFPDLSCLAQATTSAVSSPGGRGKKRRPSTDPAPVLAVPTALMSGAASNNVSFNEQAADPACPITPSGSISKTQQRKGKKKGSIGGDAGLMQCPTPLAEPVSAPTVPLAPLVVESTPWLQDLECRLKKNRDAIVGEIGLDNLRVKQCPMAAQIQIFEAQLTLAAKHNRPVSVHCVRAYDKILTIFKDRPIDQYPRSVVLHGYGGSPDFVKSLIGLSKKRGTRFYFGIGANTTLRLKAFAEIIRAIPPNRLLAESDSYEKHEGQRRLHEVVTALQTVLPKLTVEALNDNAADALGFPKDAISC